MTKLTARDLMTPDVLSVREDMTVGELATFLIDNEITGAVVKDEGGRPLGVVSVVDIAANVRERTEIGRSAPQPSFYVRGWEENYSKEEMLGLHIDNVELLVRDIMNRTVYSVSEDAPLSEVARKLLGGHLHRIVVTRKGELMGIISTSDFLKLFLDESLEQDLSTAARPGPAGSPATAAHNSGDAP